MLKTWGPIPNAPANWTWEKLMEEALVEAKKAQEADEVPVGAIIVNLEGTVIARAYNQVCKLQDPTAHAEILAIKKACKQLKNYRLNDCFLVVNLEPCLMCAGAILQARLQGLVFGAYEEKFGAIVSNCEALAYNVDFPKVWHLGHVLEGDSQILLKDFFKNKR